LIDHLADGLLSGDEAGGRIEQASDLAAQRRLLPVVATDECDEVDLQVDDQVEQPSPDRVENLGCANSGCSVQASMRSGHSRRSPIGIVLPSDQNGDLDDLALEPS
jgi:hypothetical protein